MANQASFNWEDPLLLDQQLTEDELRANRRIDIRFTIRRPDSADYEATRKLLDTK